MLKSKSQQKVPRPPQRPKIEMPGPGRALKDRVLKSKSQQKVPAAGAAKMPAAGAPRIEMPGPSRALRKRVLKSKSQEKVQRPPQRSM